MSAAAAVAAWQAAADAAKLSPALVSYREGADPLRPCRTCGYHDGAACLIVAGVISDAGTCDLWNPRPDRKESDET